MLSQAPLAGCYLNYFKEDVRLQSIAPLEGPVPALCRHDMAKVKVLDVTGPELLYTNRPGVLFHSFLQNL